MCDKLSLLKYLCLSCASASIVTAAPEPLTSSALIRDPSAIFPANLLADTSKVSEKKLELASELLPLRDTGAISATLAANIEAYLSDMSVPETDRFDIRYMQKNANLDIKHIASADQLLASRFENALELAGEYPGVPQAWHDLLWMSQRANRPLLASQWSSAKIGKMLAKDIEAKLFNLQQRFDFIGNALPETSMLIPFGKPVILYFWSIEKPQVSELLSQCALMGGLAFVGVNLDDNIDKAKVFATQLSLPGDLYYDGGNGLIETLLHVDATPTIFILDEQRRVIDVNGRFGLISKLRSMLHAPPIDQKDHIAHEINLGDPE